MKFYTLDFTIWFLSYRKGNMDICMTYLRMYVDIAEKNGLEQAYSTACHHLGSICNSLVSSFL